ncbi:MAG: hypothetical protein J6L87_04345, partial [Clostridia bacterium]|nr:hypothetical protein [Clostridia bacterium]
MDLKQTWRRAVALTLAFAMVLANFLFLPVLAEEGDTGEVVTTTVNLSEYIVFDLDGGNITIKGTTYTGTVWQKDANTGQWQKNAVTAYARASTDKFYIYQNSTKQTVEVDQETGILTMTALDINNNIMVNNKDIDNVVSRWANAATQGGRTANEYFISVPGAAGTYDMII